MWVPCTRDTFDRGVARRSRFIVDLSDTAWARRTFNVEGDTDEERNDRHLPAEKRDGANEQTSRLPVGLPARRLRTGNAVCNLLPRLDYDDTGVKYKQITLLDIGGKKSSSSIRQHSLYRLVGQQGAKTLYWNGLELRVREFISFRLRSDQAPSGLRQDGPPVRIPSGSPDGLQPTLEKLGSQLRGSSTTLSAYCNKLDCVLQKEILFASVSEIRLTPSALTHTAALRRGLERRPSPHLWSTVSVSDRETRWHGIIYTKVPGAKHITTSKHQANKQLNSKQRQLFLTQPTTSNEFLEKYTQHTIPDESTLRKTYAPSIYDETIQKIRDEIKDSSIWVSIDETPDKEGRLVGNVVIGLLSEQYSERILLHCDVLEKCNNKTIVKLFNEAMGILWPKGIMYDNVLFFISDAAPYMVKAGQALSVVYPKLTHFTCVAHAFHRVAEVVRDNFLK
ncbi:hypothetical protein ANN_00821 [Periplaneta americana]|uniref:DUF659 domain-containing protein n=1 Tax=Periplaneta americana TaxID=6978 RepID=A0ABQ8TTN2_PERAM|nr:hypothetical protein ANN_00821 [Periplaneta americana]